MTFEGLIDAFYNALSAHENEEDAYDDVQKVMDQAVKDGFTIGECAGAYMEAYLG